MKIRLCPKCTTERPLTETLCRGTVQGRRCGWDLTGVAITEAGTGHGPAAPTTAPPATPTAGVADNDSRPRCSNGHPVDPGDFICPRCGVDLDDDTPAVHQAQPPTADSTLGEVADWRLRQALPYAADAPWQRYRAVRAGDAVVGLLTYYRPGQEPDPAVQSVLDSMDTEHVPQRLGSGRWQQRAFSVCEWIDGGDLSRLDIDLTDSAQLHRLVDQIGRALDAFDRAGLRHRALRPEVVLVRCLQPLDLVIDGFGSARLSDFDLDSVSTLETTPYMAPELVAGGVSPASDWWSLGILLLEKLTAGRCFDGIGTQAFLIDALANGVLIPPELPAAPRQLLTGLLLRDRHRRWRWPQVRAWLDGDGPAVTGDAATVGDGASTGIGAGPGLTLGGVEHQRLAGYALAAAEAGHWDEATEQLLGGRLIDWVRQQTEATGDTQGKARSNTCSDKLIPRLRALASAGLEPNWQLALSLKLLNPDLPLVQRGVIVTPAWLLEHPAAGYRLISGPVPGLLHDPGLGQGGDPWLSGLAQRATAVRARARNHAITLDEETLQVQLLATSRARLAALWQEKRRLLPDTDHPGLAAVLERPQPGDEDLILLLAANADQFRPLSEVIDAATALARHHGPPTFDRDTAADWLREQSRGTLYQRVDECLTDFGRCGIEVLDRCADAYRLEHRLPLEQALLLLSVPAADWQRPASQDYSARIIDFFEQKLSLAAKRGPLARMIIGPGSRRIDLTELASERQLPTAMLERILSRGGRAIPLDPMSLAPTVTAQTPERTARLGERLRSLQRHALQYSRDTGIDGLHLGFPFLLLQPSDRAIKPRIAPLLLWPVRLDIAPGQRSGGALAFDTGRAAVRINPALDGLLDTKQAARWRERADQVLRNNLQAAGIMELFETLAPARSKVLEPLPTADVEVTSGGGELACAAVLFHVTFAGQAVVEDLRRLKAIATTGTALQTCLRIDPQPLPDEAADDQQLPEAQRYLTVASDPSQEQAIRRARHAPGLLIEGPPGTGKSQTIVNLIADAIGQGRTLLLVCQKQAALEVVHKRLLAENLGGRVVMVNDVNKDRRPLLKQLRDELARRFGNPAEPGWRKHREQTAARIEALESELDRHHQALHRVDPHCGLSYRRLIGELLDLEQGDPPRIDVPGLRPLLSGLDPAALAVVEQDCVPLGRLWLASGYEDSPLHGLRLFARDAATLAHCEADLRRLATLETSRLEALQRHRARFGLANPAAPLADIDADANTDTEMAGPQRLVDALARLDRLAPIHLDSDPYPLLRELDDRQLLAWRGAARCANSRPTGLARLSPWPWWQRLRVKRLLARHRSDVLIEISTETGVDIVHRFEQWTVIETERRHWVTTITILAQTLGEPWRDLATLPLAPLWQRGRACLDRSAASNAPRTTQPATPPVSIQVTDPQRPLTVLDDALAPFTTRDASRAALATLEPWLRPELLTRLDQRIAEHLPLPVLDAILEHLGELPAFARFRDRSSGLSESARQVFAALRTAEPELKALPPDPPAGQSEPPIETQLHRILKREARLAWKATMEQATPALLSDSDELAARVRDLAAADRDMRRLNRSALNHGVDLAGLAAATAWEAITRLTGPRAVRLREFLRRGVDLGLMKLWPVWLMNPEVASQLLPLRSALFDLVVFDEASQMPVEYALPALYRARLLIVSGDEQQLPPTRFFSSRVESDEAEVFDGEPLSEGLDDEQREVAEEAWNRREIKDCPDLLLLARAVLPRAMLQVHYRSESRALIAFSNAAFYRGALHVPASHPDAVVRQRRPIEVQRVDGQYADQSNPDEAQAVVDRLDRLWRGPDGDGPEYGTSVGVVTFNCKQAELIEEALERRAEDDTVFRQAYLRALRYNEDGEDQGLFVKNVEAVQGDERDLMLFSTTFGRGPNGRFRRNFGVLGQKFGQRRLNVAVTRARRRIVLLTSIPTAEVSDLINSARRPSSPRDYLQAYLQYAQHISDGELDAARGLLARMDYRPASAAPNRVPDRIDDGFPDRVEAFLREHRWPLTTVTDDSAFAFDFAITAPDGGPYLLGIECDAPQHPLLRRARAREVWRPAVLMRSIPRIHRVSCFAWYHDPQRERERLRAAIEAALDADGDG
jgi:DNA polymerase III delta prime subunit